jgi:hypothetical protein
MSSIEKLVCVDQCPGSSSENRPIAQAKVYGNRLASSPAVLVNQQCIGLSVGAAQPHLTAIGRELPVSSRSVLMVITQEPSQPLATLHGLFTTRFRGKRQLNRILF